MEYKLQYRSSRREVWQWYWRNWASERWRYHLATFSWLFAALLAFFLLFNWQSLHTTVLIAVLGLAIAGTFLSVALVTLISAVFSQLLFKGGERELVVTRTGWSTKIGRQSGSRSWSETYKVQDIGYAIAIQGEQGNSLVVPNRAFQSPDARKQFLADTQSWLSSAWA